MSNRRRNDKGEALHASVTGYSRPRGDFTIRITRGAYGGFPGLTSQELEAIAESVALQLETAFTAASKDRTS